jgi:hypothetical protein
MTGEHLTLLVEALRSSEAAIAERGEETTTDAITAEFLSSHADVWKVVMVPLAQERLAEVIKSRRVKRTLVPSNTPRLVGFEELGKQAAYPAGRFLWAEASPEQIHDYRQWYEKRHTGTVKRSAREEERLGKLIELDTAAQRYARKNQDITGLDVATKLQAALERKAARQ